MRTEQELINEIDECNRCIACLSHTMREMGVSDEEIPNNVMIKAYMERYEKAKAELRSLKEPERETRRFFTEIFVDENFNDKYDEIGPGDFLESKMKPLAESGIKLENWLIADDDDDEPRARYINYLLEWCFEHAEQFDGPPESPLSFEQWMK